jgi:glycine/D-amino acid oxidase-like deaminating enzyme
VLGAGLAGSCVALELAKAGVAVDLYDQHDDAMVGASANNEGKIHLGYVYANDDTLATAATMVRGALTFMPLLRRILGRDVDALGRSTGFDYVVHRDSLLTVDELEAHMNATAGLAAAELDGGEADYFGADVAEPPTRLSTADWSTRFDARVVQGVFRTREVAVDPAALTALVRSALAVSSVRSRFLERVGRVRIRDRGIDVVTDRATRRYDHVVNALWEGRAAVDESAGVAAPEQLVRYKRFVRLPPPSGVGVPSATVVLGAFGDVVSYDDGSLYLSWYPEARCVFAVSRGVPAPPPLGSGVAGFIDRSIGALGAIVPAVARLPRSIDGAVVGGGYIVARGATDVDDRASGLHSRTEIGVTSTGCYHSIDTGKLTTAPLLARDTASRVLDG